MTAPQRIRNAVYESQSDRRLTVLSSDTVWDVKDPVSEEHHSGHVRVNISGCHTRRPSVQPQRTTKSVGGQGQRDGREALSERKRPLFTPVFSMPLSKALKFCSYRSLAIFAKFIPRYFVSLVGSIRRIFSLIIFSKPLV